MRVFSKHNNRSKTGNRKGGYKMKSAKQTLAALFAITVMAQVIWAQEVSILSSQKVAIKTLATERGFTSVELNGYLYQTLGASIDNLTAVQGAAMIRRFQSDNPPKPGDAKPQTAAFRSAPAVRATPRPPEPAAPIRASILEVGMSKRFHLLDGNIINGSIIKIVDGVCHIETIDGLLQVPSEVILEETATIRKKDDTRYVGPVLRDTDEEIVLRSVYGDVVISKRDIKDMDRYYGGKRVAWAEEKKRFYQGEATLTDIFNDPTAFPLPANTFYVSGLSIGYAFTDRFMVRSKFGNDFQGDLNLQPIFQFYHRQTGRSEVASAVGIHMYNHHPVTALGAKYSNQIVDSTGSSINSLGVPLSEAMSQRNSFYWEAYLILSSRQALSNDRGKLGWHLGLRTNSLAVNKPALNEGYKWNEKFIPYRAWAGFEYDLSKRLKLIMEMWADNGHKFRNIGDTYSDYFTDGTPFVFDSAGGEYRPVDFDFGVLYALKDNLRLGLHFQEPYFVIYWEFYEL